MRCGGSTLYGREAHAHLIAWIVLLRVLFHEWNRIAHIPHLQTSTIGIICSCLQPVFAALGYILAIRACFEKRSFEKERHIDG
jgi:hypothetical protein